MDQFERLIRNQCDRRSIANTIERNADSIDFEIKLPNQTNNSKLKSNQSHMIECESTVKELQSYILDIKQQLIRLQIQQTNQKQTSEKVEILE